MKIYLNKESAEKLASNYQWLIGKKFHTPNGYLSIDFVKAEVEKDDPNKHHVVVQHNAFKKGSIPEYFGFKNPTVELADVLKQKHLILSS